MSTSSSSGSDGRRDVRLGPLVRGSEPGLRDGCGRGVAPTRPVMRVGTLLALSLGAACQETPLLTPLPATIVVSDSAPLLGVDDSLTFTVEVLDARGRALSSSDWPRTVRSLAPTILSYADDLLVGRSAGHAVLEVRAGTLERLVGVTVLPPVLRLFRDSAGTAIEIPPSPDTLELTAGDSVDFRVAIASVPTRDLTLRYTPTWSVDDLLAAELSDPSGATTTLVAVLPGDVTLLLSTGLAERTVPVRIRVPPPEPP